MEHVPTLSIRVEETAETAAQLADILDRIAERLRKGDTTGFNPQFTIIPVPHAQSEQA